MNFFAITRHGLATIAILVAMLWCLVLATAASQRQTASEARLLQIERSHANLPCASRAVIPLDRRPRI